MIMKDFTLTRISTKVARTKAEALQIPMSDTDFLYRYNQILIFF